MRLRPGGRGNREAGVKWNGAVLLDGPAFYWNLYLVISLCLRQFLDGLLFGGHEKEIFPLIGLVDKVL